MAGKDQRDVMPREAEGDSGREPVSVAKGAWILAPTLLEYWALRCMLPRARVVRAGVRLARWRGASAGSVVVVCGLGGSLTTAAPSGSVLVPEEVSLPDGRALRCDPELGRALVTTARALGYQPVSGPLLTSPALVTAAARDEWAGRGFVAADMETGLLAGQNLRVGALRVVLDSPERGISDEWLRPASALLRPRLWGELAWLGRAAPLYALRAARILRAGLAGLDGPTAGA